MSEYNPDVWVVLKITTPEHTTYKVLAGWYGGFATGDSWKLNSGITKVTEDGDFFCFDGWSGSTYRCHKSAYRMSGMTSSVLASFQKDIENEYGITIEVMPEDTKWMELDYGE